MMQYTGAHRTDSNMQYAGTYGTIIGTPRIKCVLCDSKHGSVSKFISHCDTNSHKKMVIIQSLKDLPFYSVDIEEMNTEIDELETQAKLFQRKHRRECQTCGYVWTRPKESDLFVHLQLTGHTTWWFNQIDQTEGINIREQLRDSRDRRSFCCEMCKVTFFMPEYLEQHKQTITHKSKIIERKRVSKRKKQRIARRDPTSDRHCDVCNHTFTMQRDLLRHYETDTHKNNLQT
jgi:hypothetical protein